MNGKLRIATIGAVAAALFVPGVVLAQEDGPGRPDHAIRAAGEITEVSPDQGSFSLSTRRGEELEFTTNEETQFRSPNGAVQGIEDLEAGMKAMVLAAEQGDGSLLAKVVGAGHPEDLPDGKRFGGLIESVDLDGQSFMVKSRDGDSLRIQTGDRTRFRGEGIEGLADLQPGMHTRGVAIEQDDGGLMALLVGAGTPKDRPGLVKLGGQIKAVSASESAFSLLTEDGREVRISTNERTKFHSRDGSVQSLEDLEAGMHAGVGAVQTDDGGLMAAFVGIGVPGDRPGLDVKAGGEVVAKSGSSFTIQKQNGEEITFLVNADTHFKGISDYRELEVGMMAGVGAVEMEEGLLAVFVGAGERGDRPRRAPHDGPGRGPGPNGGEDQVQEVSA